MSGGIIREVETVSIPRDQLIALLDAAQQVRTGFLMCAPRFAAGSSGERMVAVASAFGKTIEDIRGKLDDKKDKSSDIPHS